MALILAHRGASGDLPENTLASFREAVRQGADFVELDLQLTADGRLVAVHDRSLRRVSGHSVVVEDTAFHVLRHLSVSQRHPGSRRIVLPCLEEVFEALPAPIALNLDLKCRRAGRRRYAEALVAAIRHRRHLLLSSFNWPLLLEVRRRLPGCPVAPAVHRRFVAALRVAGLLGADTIAVHHRFLRARYLRAAAARGRSVFAFTVNDAREARRLLAMGVAGLYTNHPGRLRSEIAR